MVCHCDTWPSKVGEVGFFLPVGLHQDAVDVVDVDGLVGAADGLDQTTDTEVAGLAQDAVGGADDEVNGRSGEGVVAKSGAIEFTPDEPSRPANRILRSMLR